MLRIEISGCSETEYQCLANEIRRSACLNGVDWDGGCCGSCTQHWNGIIHYVENEEWKPKKGESYYLVNAAGKAVFYTWEDDATDKELYRVENCFRTQEEAEASELYKAYRR